MILILTILIILTLVFTMIYISSLVRPEGLMRSMKAAIRDRGLARIQYKVMYDEHGNRDTRFSHYLTVNNGVFGSSTTKTNDGLFYHRISQTSICGRNINKIDLASIDGSYKDTLILVPSQINEYGMYVSQSLAKQVEINCDNFPALNYLVPKTILTKDGISTFHYSGHRYYTELV